VEWSASRLMKVWAMIHCLTCCALLMPQRLQGPLATSAWAGL
jgi:hypothetical protein